MATQVQFRRGTTTENNAFTGAVAELTVDTTLTTLRVHNGTSAGGIALINANSSQVITNKTYGNGNTWEGSPPTLTYGGTGKSLTAVQGGIVYSDSDSMEISLAGTAGQVLTSGGTAAPIWVTPSSLTVGTASVATTASNIAGGSAGYLVYQFDTNDTSFIEPGASGTFLRSTGASTAPDWATASVTIGTTEIDLGQSSLSLGGVTTIESVSDSHWTIPVGTIAQRPGTPANGMIRYNTEISSFEGYGPGSSWGSLGGVKDVDGDTYLLTEVSAGSDEDTFEFYNAGVNTMALDGTALTLKNDTYLKFDTDATAEPASHTEGALYYSNEYKALTYQNDITGSSLQIGLEEWIRVYNNTGSTITNGTPVYVTGASGETPTVAPSDATTAMKAEVIGVVTNDIPNNSSGIATTRGLISGFDTSALTPGQRVHVGPSGALQTAAPTAPYFPTDVGTCIVSDASSGYIYVTIQEHTFEQFRVTGNTKMDGNLTVTGDLTVSGTQTITSQANLALDNAFIYMNSGDTIGEANTTFTGSGLDDAYFTGHFEGTSSTSYYVRIDGVGTGTGGVDTFEWSKDNWSTTEATGVDITGDDQALDNNIKIFFNATTGHTDNDQWSGTAAPLNVDTGWASNRNTGASGVGYTHIGCMYDVASNQFIMFDEYDPEIEGNIDTAHASFEYGNLQIAGLTATTGAFSSNGTIGGNLTVTGTTILNDNVDLNGNLDVSGTTILNDNVDINGNLDVSGNITSSSGAISFGDENLSTTGTLSAGATTVSSLSATTVTLGDPGGNHTVIGQNSVTTTGTFTLDCSSDITIDAGGADIYYKSNGTQYARFTSGSPSTMWYYGGISLKSTTSDFEIDSAADIILDADGADVILKDAGTETLRFNGGTVTRTGDFTVDASGSITLDADSGAIYLKDGPVGEFARFVDIGGNLQIKSNEVTALTFSDADATFAGTVNIGSDTLAEYIADTVGAMVTGNSETGITVTYQDADNTLDFSVAVPTLDSLGIDTDDDVTHATITATDGVVTTSANPFVYSANTISSNVTVPSNYNAMAAGPITVNNGVTVTVPSGSTLTIV